MYTGSDYDGAIVLGITIALRVILYQNIVKVDILISSRFRWLKQLHNPEVDSPRGLCKLLKLPKLGSLQVVSNWFEILAIKIRRNRLRGGWPWHNLCRGVIIDFLYDSCDK